MQESKVLVAMQRYSTELTVLFRREHLLKSREDMCQGMLTEINCRHMYRLKKQTKVQKYRIICVTSTTGGGEMPGPRWDLDQVRYGFSVAWTLVFSPSNDIIMIMIL